MTQAKGSASAAASGDSSCRQPKHIAGLDKGLRYTDQFGETAVDLITKGLKPRTDVLKASPALTACTTGQCRAHRHHVARLPIRMTTRVDDFTGEFVPEDRRLA